MQCNFAGHDEIRNILVTLCYDGSKYHGWQIQQNATTVQEIFQNALYRIIKDKVDIKGCSRTDSKVHANMYCASFKIKHKIECERLQAALNRHLPMKIAVYDCKEIPIDFHARYSCLQKEYIYKIWNSRVRNPFLEKYALHYYWQKIDEHSLNLASQAFVGKHDFTSFCTIDDRKRENMVRNVESFSVKRDGDMVIMVVRADGFLYNMVRIMVGTLLQISNGRIEADAIPEIILAKDRLKAGPRANPCGLYLNKVFYEGIN